jgi:hypothetical protein
VRVYVLWPDCCRQHVRYTRAPLAFFAGPILASAMQCEAASRAAESTGFLNAARVRKYVVWDGGSFCGYQAALSPRGHEHGFHAWVLGYLSVQLPFWHSIVRSLSLTLSSPPPYLTPYSPGPSPPPTFPSTHLPVSPLVMPLLLLFMPQSYSARAMLLWSLFPSFCVSPCDVPTAFNPQLGQLLTKAVADTRCVPCPSRVVQPAHSAMCARCSCCACCNT